MIDALPSYQNKDREDVLKIMFPKFIKDLNRYNEMMDMQAASQKKTNDLREKEQEKAAAKNKSKKR